MRKITELSLLLILSFFQLQSSAQKQDYYWPFGFKTLDDPAFGAVEFDFNKEPFKVGVREAGLEFDQNNASICDPEGSLLFYTNGCAVSNRHHQTMPNGDSINAGIFFDQMWQGRCEWGYPGQQNVTILNDPGNPDGYYLLTVPFVKDDIFEPTTIVNINYSYVDMKSDGGNGAVTTKNNIFHEGEILSSYLTTIAHANGQDWWIINPVFPSGYVVYLLDESGFNFSSLEQGPFWDTFYSSGAGDARFSPDGEQYAIFNRWEGVRVYDFDRNTGTLSNEQVIPWHFGGTGLFTTCEWSPNSRFLYVAQFDSLFQLDTEVVPLEEGLEFISVHNGVSDPFGTFFFKSALGPDCRIYIRPGSATNSFHVIHKPDEKGVACDFQQQGIRLPYISSTGSFPNFPRFRVDEEEKCDPSITSIAGEAVWWRRELAVYPSPARHHLTVELPEGFGQGRLYAVNMQGQLVYDEKVAIQQMRLDVSAWAAGTYYVEFIPEDEKGRTLWTSQVIVVK